MHIHINAYTHIHTYTYTHRISIASQAFGRLREISGLLVTYLETQDQTLQSPHYPNYYIRVRDMDNEETRGQFPAGF